MTSGRMWWISKFQQCSLSVSFDIVSTEGKVDISFRFRITTFPQCWSIVSSPTETFSITFSIQSYKKWLRNGQSRQKQKFSKSLLSMRILLIVLEWCVPLTGKIRFIVYKLTYTSLQSKSLLTFQLLRHNILHITTETRNV